MGHYEKKIRGEELFRGRVITVQKDRVLLEDGTESDREIVRHHGGAGILAITPERETYFVRQFRYAYDRELLEIPAGKLEPGEDSREAAIRELKEECGITAGRVISLNEILPTVGYCDEIIHLYLALDLTQGADDPDAGEFLSVEKHSLSEAVDMVMDGTVRDAKTVTAILEVQYLLEHGKITL